jgi:hypothetical protein
VGKTGKKIDVKTTKYQNGKLLAVLKKKEEDTDVYVLMLGEFPTYRYAGWAWASELIDERNIKNLGYGPTYVMEQDRLHQERE